MNSTHHHYRLSSGYIWSKTFIKTLLTTCLISSIFIGQAQIVYFDIVKDQSIKVHGKQVSQAHQKTKERLIDHRNYGILIQAKLADIKALQNRVQKALSEISSIISDGLTTKESVELTLDILRSIDETKTLVLNNPHHVVFVNNAIKIVNQRVLRFTTQLALITKGNNSILMDASERKKLINKFHQELVLLRASINNLNLSFNRVSSLRIMALLNPFSSYKNHENHLIFSIMKDVKTNK